ncbi:MAG: conjugal transfer protein TraI [Legionellales bacterium RIFCSPHIGHO2_12_FULL_37_14]|nr:MAG: conjugal transfer protein TraI [Legionellales bacterium RIFCSPHIGHO2_12_FULL_37_14]
MISIKPLKSAKAAAEYYTQTFNYYANDATSMRFMGKACNILNLGNAITKTQMLALLEGKLPNGQKLQNAKGEHRPGFDMTFSAPKSVSILVGLGIAKELEKYHDKAVEYAINHIEKEFSQTRVIKSDKLIFEKTGNLLIAAFRQPSSRANDPALHTHCVTMNMTFLAGKAKSLASDPSRNQGVIEQIQNNAHYCGLLYRSNLANQLKEAGYKLKMMGEGLFEIEGISDPVLREFSKRREDIEKLLEEKGWQGAKSASIATLLTRKGKEETNLEALKEDWIDRAAKLGFDAKTFIEQKNLSSNTFSWVEALKEKLQTLIGRETNAANACLNVAIETLSQKEAVFSEHALMTEALKHSLIYPKPITMEAIAKEINLAAKENNLYEAICKNTNQRLFTTPWLLTLETETLARIEQQKGVVPAISTQTEVKAFQKARKEHLTHPLTNSQKTAMNTLLTNRDRYLAIQGYAGVAKTSMLKEAKILIEEKGYKLRGIAIASSAANELEIKSQIKSDVFPIVHQELKNAKTGALTKMVYILDEASMLSSQQGHELLKQIERTDARLILVGDKAQLPSVNTGRIFGLAQDFGITTAHMTDIVRQKNNEAKAAVMLATQGKVKEALDKIEVTELNTHEERVKYIANKWLSLTNEERTQTLLFAPTHRNREDITKFIRAGLKETGDLNKKSHQHQTLIPKNLESIQIRFIANYQTKDKVRFNKNIYNAKANNYYIVGQITEKHRKNNTLPLQDENNKRINFPLKKLSTYNTKTASFERPIEVYKTKDLELVEGDKIMWTRNFKKENIRNGQSAIIKKIAKDTIELETNKGEIITLEKNNKAMQHIDYSYVLTNYKAQGKDAKYALGLMESYHKFCTTLKNFYVQISRAQEKMTLITDNKESVIKTIQNNKGEKETAIERLSTKQIKTHQERFNKTTKLDTASLIAKKIAHEKQMEY